MLKYFEVIKLNKLKKTVEKWSRNRGVSCLVPLPSPVFPASFRESIPGSAPTLMCITDDGPCNLTALADPTNTSEQFNGPDQ